MGDQSFRVIEHLEVICTGTVPFKECKLRVMKLAALPPSEAAAELKEFIVSRRQQPLHIEFGGSGEKPAFAVEGDDVLLGSHFRHPDGRFHFQETLVSEESPGVFVDERPALQVSLPADF